MTRLTQDEFVKLWLCGNPRHHSYAGGYWSNGHLPLDVVKREARQCAPLCGCWRHRVIDWASVRLQLQTGSFNLDTWLKDHIAHIMQKPLQIQRESENVNREEIIQARIRDLEAELAQRRVYGRDTYGDGTVLSWSKTFPNTDEVFHYAAIKASNGFWYITNTRSPLSWDNLVTNHWVTDEPVAEVFVVREWRVIGREDETVQTAPLASWIGTAEVKSSDQTEVRGE